MKIPTIQGVIDRRILINYAVDKDVLARILPAPFRPKLVAGKGIAGICLIRLKHIRPAGFPAMFGIGSENAAHRIAVEWSENGATREGVYIPRRDTNSLLNHWAGGRVFPGVHHLSTFDIDEKGGSYKIKISAADSSLIYVDASESDSLSKNSVFGDLSTASAFFRNGAIGFSPNKSAFDGLELKPSTWHVKPLTVKNVRSSFFGNEQLFPGGSVSFDNALLMKNIEHTWNSYPGCICS